MPFVADDHSEMRALIDGAYDLASEAEGVADSTDRSHLAGWLVLSDWLAGPGQVQPGAAPSAVHFRAAADPRGRHNDAALAALKGSDVEILTIANGWTISQSGYYVLAGCPQLRRLSIDRGHYLDDDALA